MLRIVTNTKPVDKHYFLDCFVLSLRAFAGSIPSQYIPPITLWVMFVRWSPIFQNRSSYTAWARVLQRDYEELRRNVGLNRRTFINEYGAENPAEFFAVTTEYFFEKPRELKKFHPELYHELKLFYQQDPAEL